MVNRDQLTQLKEGTDLIGMLINSLAIPALQAGGLNPVLASAVSTLLIQVLPHSLLWAYGARGREGREMRRIEQVLQQLGALLASPDLAPVQPQVEELLGRYPRVVDLIELTLRKVESDARSDKSRAYAQVLRDCLLFPEIVNADHAEREGMIEALSALSVLDLTLLETVKRLQLQPHGSVSVPDLTLLEELDPAGEFSGGFLDGRVSLLVQLGLLGESATAYNGSFHGRTGRHFSRGRTYTLTPYAQAFQAFCVAGLPVPA